MMRPKEPSRRTSSTLGGQLLLLTAFLNGKERWGEFGSGWAWESETNSVSISNLRFQMVSFRHSISPRAGIGRGLFGLIDWQPEHGRQLPIDLLHIAGHSIGDIFGFFVVD